MSKVTFYLGAGASCKALPLIKQIPERLQAAIDFLSCEEMLQDNEIIDNQPDSSYLEYQKLLIGDMEWLRDESNRHATIDTFAKKLRIRHEEKSLLRLKSALIAFFAIE